MSVPVRAVAAALAVWACLGSGAVASAAPAELRLERLRLAGSLLGAPRAEFRAGEVVVVRFDVAGATLTASGELALETGIRVRDADGKLIADEPVVASVQTPNLFRADAIPCFFSIPPQILAGPGPYTISVRAVDRSTTPARAAHGKVTVTFAPPGFGLGNRRITLDAQGAYEAAGPYRVGQTVFFCQHVLGYGVREGAVDLQLDVEVRDLDGALLGAKEAFHRLNQPVPGRPPFLTTAAFLSLTRAGSFEVRVTVIDRVLGERATAAYRVTVVGAPQ